MAAFSAIMRGMNILLSIAITTGILSGIWGWVAVSLGLLSWAGFLGCTAYFACPQGGLKGLAISAATLLSGVVWAMVIIYGSALAPHLEILGYVITGIVAFLMCIQAIQSQILGGLLSNINTGKPGRMVTNDYIVDIANRDGQLQLNVTDRKTGQTSTIQVSGLQNNSTDF